jgi:hypothetical protein
VADCKQGDNLRQAQLGNKALPFLFSVAGELPQPAPKVDIGVRTALGWILWRYRHPRIYRIGRFSDPIVGRLRGRPGSRT